MASDGKTLVTNNLSFVSSLFLGRGGHLEWLGLDVKGGVWAWEAVE